MTHLNPFFSLKTCFISEILLHLLSARSTSECSVPCIKLGSFSCWTQGNKWEEANPDFLFYISAARADSIPQSQAWSGCTLGPAKHFPHNLVVILDIFVNF